MATIETKYSEGDTVYSFGTVYAKKTIQCPDCLGTRKWRVSFADGRSEDCPCYTCSRGYEGPHGLIFYSEWVPSVDRLTIKEVRYGRDGAEYLSDYWYTGDDGQPYYGTRIHRDRDLFDTEPNALAAAQVEYEKRMACLADNNFPKQGDFAKALERSTYGFCRHEAIKHTVLMKQWLDILRPLKPKNKHLRQFDGDHKSKEKIIGTL